MSLFLGERLHCSDHLEIDLQIDLRAFNIHSNKTDYRQCDAHSPPGEKLKLQSNLTHGDDSYLCAIDHKYESSPWAKPGSWQIREVENF